MVRLMKIELVATAERNSSLTRGELAALFDLSNEIKASWFAYPRVLVRKDGTIRKITITK